MVAESRALPATDARTTTISTTASATDHVVASIEYDETARRAVRDVLAGDRAAFGVLVERELPRVIRVCYRVLGDRDDAEDAAQEAFIAAYRSLPAWRGDGPFGAWLARIALHVALRHVRRTRRPLTWIDPNALDESDEPHDPGQRRVARHFQEASLDALTGSDPAHLAVAHEEASAIREALVGLEEPYREVVALRYFGGLTVPEIAEACDRPQGTIKTHLHRGLLRLRQRLAVDEAIQ